MTPERYKKIIEVLNVRQTDLTVCLEEVHKPNNISAIIRTADAVGLHQVHAIWPQGKKVRTLAHTSAGARNWVNVQPHSDITTAINTLKSAKMQVIVTNLSKKAVDFREIDYTKPTAIILGQEKEGISDKALELADHHIMVPMVGMVQSLNVSVASAVVLYEAQRQRQLAGMYNKEYSSLSKKEINRLLFERGHPVLARVAKRKKLDYPDFDNKGEIIASDSWWEQMQSL